MKRPKITIRNLQKKIRIIPRKVKGLIFDIFSCEGVTKPADITVCFTGDREIRELNLLYLGRYEPTDVISFDLSSGKKAISADIAVSADTAIRNAKVYGTSGLYEINLYVAHGVLHLLGYDDKNASRRKAMEKRAAEILSRHVHL